MHQMVVTLTHTITNTPGSDSLNFEFPKRVIPLVFKGYWLHNVGMFDVSKEKENFHGVFSWTTAYLTCYLEELKVIMLWTQTPKTSLGPIVVVSFNHYHCSVLLKQSASHNWYWGTWATASTQLCHFYISWLWTLVFPSWCQLYMICISLGNKGYFIFIVIQHLCRNVFLPNSPTELYVVVFYYIYFYSWVVYV